MVHQEGAERAQRGDQAADLLERGHRGRARLAVYAGEVAEPLAGPALGEHALVAVRLVGGDAHAPRADEQHAVGGAALSKITAPGG